jgi:hypothetical protein
MMRNLGRSSLAPAALCGLAFTLAGSAAHADPETPEDTGQELPLPYTPWQGKNFGAPKAPIPRDLPAPLARPRERTRRPLELSAALAAFLPNCGSGSIDDHACLTVGAGSGIDAALLYRNSPFFAFGVEAALSGFGGKNGGFASSAGGSARFFGVAGRVYFADQGPWDPYVAMTLGAGTLNLKQDDQERIATTGFGARVAGGVDYLFGSHWRLGPSVSFSRWLAYGQQQCEGDVCHDESAAYGHLLGFATLSLRLTASFGDSL